MDSSVINTASVGLGLEDQRVRGLESYSILAYTICGSCLRRDFQLYYAKFVENSYFATNEDSIVIEFR